MHPSTRTNQIYIKPSRIQFIEEQNQPLVDEKPDIEYLGLMKYSNMDLVKLRKIEGNKLKTLISEGIHANYFDIVIYAIFALVNWSETQPWSFKINKYDNSYIESLHWCCSFNTDIFNVHETRTH